MTARPLTPTTATRVRWAFADTWVVALRHLTHWAQQPALAVVGLLFPVMILAMFGFLFGGAMAVPNGHYAEFLVPGVLGLTMLFGVEETFTAVSDDASKGITDRFRTLPMAASAPLAGRCLSDLLRSTLVLAALVAVGVAMGWRWHEGLASALAAFGLLLLLRFAMLWVGVYLGLTFGTPEAVMALQILVWPIGFLSNAVVAPGTMPGWLGTIADWNPMSATVAAARELFGNPAWTVDTWPAHHPVLTALAWPVVLIALFGPLSVRRYRRLNR